MKGVVLLGDRECCVKDFPVPETIKNWAKVGNHYYFMPLNIHRDNNLWYNIKLVNEIGIPLALRGSFQLLGHRFLQEGRHPDHTLQPTISLDELGADDVEFGMAEETGGLSPPAHLTCECRELHPAGGHLAVLAVDDHYPAR